MTRCTPVSPTNMWCASSVSMKRQVRDSGSKPDCASAASCILPSRSVKKVNMKNDSQSGVCSLNAPSMRGRVLVAGAAPQQFFGFLAAVAAKIFLQQIDHRPEVAAFLDVHLEQVAQVIERRRGGAEVPLLLDRGRFGIALDHQQAAQHGAIFAGHFLPGRLALVRAERDGAAFDLRRQQDAPAVFRHANEIELGPALAADADGGAQIDRAVLEALRPHRLPPVDVAGVPGLQRLADAQIVGEADIVRDQAVIVDLARCRPGLQLSSCKSFQTRSGLKSGRDAGAVAFQRACLTDRVRPLENPVLPGGQSAEDPRLHRLRAGEAQVGLQRRSARRARTRRVPPAAAAPRRPSRSRRRRR